MNTMASLLRLTLIRLPLTAYCQVIGRCNRTVCSHTPLMPLRPTIDIAEAQAEAEI